MVEVVHGRSVGGVRLQSTKELELLRWQRADGAWEWVLEITAYGLGWSERYARKLDAYRMLRDRWGIGWDAWRALCREARVVGRVGLGRGETEQPGTRDERPATCSLETCMRSG